MNHVKNCVCDSKGRDPDCYTEPRVVKYTASKLPGPYETPPRQRPRRKKKPKQVRR